MSDEVMIRKPRGLRWVMSITVVRFLVLFLLSVAAYVGCMMSLKPLMAQAPADQVPLWDAGLKLGVCVAMFAIYRILIRLVEGRLGRELLLVEAPSPIVRGALVGAGLFSAVYAILYLLGDLSFVGVNGTSHLMGLAALSAMAAVGEEIIMRGVVFRVLEDGFGTFVAIVLSGALFGLLHAANPGATTISSAAIAVEAGMLLAAAYAATRSLWLPIGIHFGWNFAEGGIFGAAVSGGKSEGLLRFTASGPDLITGGAFGPEASVVAVGVCVLAALYLLVLAVRRKRWKKIGFRMLLA